MRYDEMHKRWLGLPPAYFEVDEVYEYYLSSVAKGWDMPKRWLMSVKYEAQLKDHPGMYGLRLNESGQVSMAGIPVVVGNFDFRIAVVVGSPHQCRIGDFVEPDSLPPVFGKKDFIRISSVSTPRFSPAGEVLPLVQAEIMDYRKTIFFDEAGKIFTLWKREL